MDFMERCDSPGVLLDERKERRRTHSINSAFGRLRSHIPNVPRLVLISPPLVAKFLQDVDLTVVWKIFMCSTFYCSYTETDNPHMCSVAFRRNNISMCACQSMRRPIKLNRIIFFEAIFSSTNSHFIVSYDLGFTSDNHTCFWFSSIYYGTLIALYLDTYFKSFSLRYLGAGRLYSMCMCVIKFRKRSFRSGLC